MAKSKLIASQSAHKVSLSPDTGVASSRKGADKAKKRPVDEPPAPLPVPAARERTRPARVNRISPVVVEPEALAQADQKAQAGSPAKAPAPRRAPSPRPKAPQLSPELQARMEAMTQTLSSLRQQLERLQAKPASRAPRRKP